MIDANPLMQTLAWSLLHFLWQGTAIAALAGACMFVFRRPSTRYLIGVIALAGMFASFATTFALLGGADDTRPGAAARVAGAASAHLPNYMAAPAAHDAARMAADFLWVARAWLVGVSLFALRLAFGLLLIEQLRRRNLAALPVAVVDRCIALQQRLGITRVVRYCECRLVSVPAVIGFLRPIVLLPVRALTGLSPEQLEAVIAHELGHVRRFDVAVNFVQVIAETLFFFHPAVWWLNRRIRADREDCCDDVAVDACGRNAGYARALATMESWRGAPALAMTATGGPVAARVARLLGMHRPRAANRAAGMLTASLVLATALLAGAASIGFAKPALVTPGYGSFQQLVVQAGVAKTARAAPEAAPAPAVKPAPRIKAAPASAPPRAGADGAASAGGGSYIDDMKTAGFDNLDVDHLVAMKIHGVTPAYVRELRDAGFTPDADQVIAMAVHGVNREFVSAIRAQGFKPDAEELIAMKAQGITPEYITSMRAAGFDADAQQLIAMKVQNVTPEYRRLLESAGYKLDASELIEASVMGITPAFIEQVRAHGFGNLEFRQLIQLKMADVL